MKPATLAALTLVGTLSLTVSCSGCTSPLPEPVGGEPAFVARGVELELPAAGGQLVARGDQLTIGDGGAVLTLEGDASVRLEAGNGFAARANRVQVRPADQRVELSGSVRARLEIEGAADGGM